MTATNREYDGTTAVALAGGALQGVVVGDTVGFDLGNGTMASASAGSGKAVTTSIQLTGADKDNYTLTQPNDVTVNITAKALTITGVTATARTYDGTTAVTLAGGALQGVVGGDTVGFDLGNGTMASASAGSGKAVTTSIQLTGADKDNYTLTQPNDVTVNITAKTLQNSMIAVTGALVYNGTEQTVTFTVTDSTILTANDWEVSGSSDKGTDATSYTLTVNGKGNYTGNATAEWSIAKRSISDAVITLESSSLVYDGSVKVLNIQSVMCGTLAVTYDVQGTTDRATDIGDYTLTVVGNGNFSGSSDAAWSIVNAVYTVTFNANGHGTAPGAQQVTEGQKAVKPANPASDGFNFFGWYKEAACSNAWDFNTAIMSDTTLYAKWEAVEKKNADPGSSAEFVIDVPIGKFVKLVIDGSEVDISKYTATESDGKTLIKLDGELTSGLNVGEHAVVAVTTDGDVNCRLDINSKSNGLPLWIIALVTVLELVLIVIAFLLWAKRHQKEVDGK